MDNSIRDHLENYGNLPDCMKDFHDQKDIFKTIWLWWGKEIEEERKINWVDAMTFTIDNFLLFMGIHGINYKKTEQKMFLLEI